MDDIPQELPKQQKYILNEKEYNSLEEVPEPFRKMFDNYGKFVVNTKEHQHVDIIIPSGDLATQSNINKVRYLVIGAVYLLSFAENQAISMFTRGLNLVGQNIILEIIVSIIIGELSYRYAVRDYAEKKKNMTVNFEGSLGFINNLTISALAAKYGFILYSGYYMILYFLTRLLAH